MAPWALLELDPIMIIIIIINKKQKKKKKKKKMANASFWYFMLQKRKKEERKNGVTSMAVRSHDLHMYDSGDCVRGGGPTVPRLH